MIAAKQKQLLDKPEKKVKFLEELFIPSIKWHRRKLKKSCASGEKNAARPHARRGGGVTRLIYSHVNVMVSGVEPSSLRRRSG